MTADNCVGLLTAQGLGVRAQEGPFIHCSNPQTGNSLHASKPFCAGAIVSPFTALNIHPTPNMYTLQAGENKHIDLGPAVLNFTNHACDPNIFFNVDDWVIEALRDIQPGDQLTFFYPSTEWDVACPFACECKSAGCLGRISGAMTMPTQQLQGHRLNNHISRLLAARQAGSQ